MHSRLLATWANAEGSAVRNSKILKQRTDDAESILTTVHREVKVFQVKCLRNHSHVISGVAPT